MNCFNICNISQDILSFGAAYLVLIFGLKNAFSRSRSRFQGPTRKPLGKIVLLKVDEIGTVAIFLRTLITNYVIVN